MTEKRGKRHPGGCCKDDLPQMLSVILAVMISSIKQGIAPRRCNTLSDIFLLNMQRRLEAPLTAAEMLPPIFLASPTMYTSVSGAQRHGESKSRLIRIPVASSTVSPRSQISLRPVPGDDALVRDLHQRGAVLNLIPTSSSSFGISLMMKHVWHLSMIPAISLPSGKIMGSLHLRRRLPPQRPSCRPCRGTLSRHRRPYDVGPRDAGPLV